MNLSPDEKNPDIQNSIGGKMHKDDISETVYLEPTDSLYNKYIVFDLIVVCYQQTTNLRELEREHPETVGRYKTILTSDIFGKVASKSRELKVFTVPTLLYLLNISLANRTYVYNIISDLESDGLVVQTGYSVQKPDPSRTGEAPGFYRYTDVDLDPSLGREDPLLKKAQREYEIAFFNRNPRAREEAEKKLSVKNRQLEICRSVTDYYRKRGQVGKYQAPQLDWIITRIKTLYPELDAVNRADVARQIYQTLSREASP